MAAEGGERMEKAVVCRDIAPVFAGPGEDTPRLDEALMGMEVFVAETGPEWCRVETQWGFTGYTRAQNLLLGQPGATEWGRYAKMAARVPYVDVLDAPQAEGAVVASLPKGGLLHVTGPQDGAGYLPVELPGGLTGYAKGGNLMPLLPATKRDVLASTALSYLGVQYRKGGRTGFGIDDVGLVLVSCRLNGAMLPGNCRPSADGPLYPVAREALAMGDVVLFAGHVGLYLGDGNFVHATDAPGSDGVVVNSLLPESPFYRKDLAENVEACGNLFAPDA